MRRGNRGNSCTLRVWERARNWFRSAGTAGHARTRDKTLTASARRVRHFACFSAEGTASMVVVADSSGNEWIGLGRHRGCCGKAQGRPHRRAHDDDHRLTALSTASTWLPVQAVASNSTSITRRARPSAVERWCVDYDQSVSAHRLAGDTNRTLELPKSVDSDAT